MGTAAAVGVDNNLSTRETGVSMRTADDELARGVDVKLIVFLGEKGAVLGVDALEHTRYQYLAHVFLNLLEHTAFAVELVMLGGEDDCVDTQRTVIVAVFDSNLALGIGAQIRHHLPFLADTGQFLQEDMRQGDGQRHIFARLVASVTEHHALVASTLFLLFLAADPLIDVATLAVDCGEHSARLGLELVLALGVANLLDDITHGLLDIDPTVAGHFAADDCQPRGHQRLAGHMAFGVTTEEFVK